MQWEQIIAASVTGLLALTGVVWQSRKTRRINTEEHEYNSYKLDRIENKLDENSDQVRAVSNRLDDHIAQHQTKKGKWLR
jgi:hypothetical protein